MRPKPHADTTHSAMPARLRSEVGAEGTQPSSVLTRSSGSLDCLDNLKARPMTLQQLHYVLAAIEHGSFSAAAEALHLAQPSLSEQVRRLEAELGVTLFQR